MENNSALHCDDKMVSDPTAGVWFQFAGKPTKYAVLYTTLVALRMFIRRPAAAASKTEMASKSEKATTSQAESEEQTLKGERGEFGGICRQAHATV